MGFLQSLSGKSQKKTRCPICQAFVTSNGKCNNTKNHPRKELNIPFTPSLATTLVKNRKIQVSKKESPITQAYNRTKNIPNVLENEKLEVAFVVEETNAQVTDFFIQEATPHATGGFLAGIPLIIKCGGKKITPDTTLWHHLTYDAQGNITISHERALLYKKLLDDLLVKATPKTNPTFVILGGGPASGKSTMEKNNQIGAPESSLKICNDDFKLLLPEYDYFLSKPTDEERRLAGAATYMEAFILTEWAQEKVLEKSCDAILDGTGSYEPFVMEQKIKQFKRKGYKVTGTYATVSIEEALERAEERYRKTGREMPKAPLINSHIAVSERFPHYIKHFDEVALWDTTTKPPTLIFSKKDKKSTLHNKTLWERFLAKKHHPKQVV